MTEQWRKVAEKVSNWGRWGDDDQIGTLNLITPERLAKGASLAKQGRAIPLGVPFDAYGPQGASGFRRNPIHYMMVDGGDDRIADVLGGWGGGTEAYMVDMYANGPMRFNDDAIIMALQAGTQWDGLTHVFYDGKLYNGYPAAAVTSFGATKNGMEHTSAAGGVMGRGVLLDIARLKGVDCLDVAYAITPQDLDAAVERQGVTIEEGDIIVLRTGWWTNFVANRNPETWLWESPGLSWVCAEWLHERGIAAIGADNPCVELTQPEAGVLLLMHCLAIRDMGMYLGECWDLEALGKDCAEDGVYEFFLNAPVLNIPGAVGSPISPFAIK